MSKSEVILLGILFIAVGLELNKIKVDINQLKGSIEICLKKT